MGSAPRTPLRNTERRRSSGCGLHALRKARFQPYMQVKAPFVDSNGQTVYDCGTLMSGWGVKNPDVIIPHSEAPESERRTKKLAASSEGDPQQGYVRVLLRGLERWIPREAVMPVEPACTAVVAKHGRWTLLDI